MTCVKTTIHDKWRLRVQVLLEAVDIDPSERIRPCDLQKLIESLKLRKACGICIVK
jgi:hypothetical protein